MSVRSGQAIIEYLLMATVVIMVLMSLQGLIQSRVDNLMSVTVARELTARGGTAERLLPR